MTKRLTKVCVKGLMPVAAISLLPFVPLCLCGEDGPQYLYFWIWVYLRKSAAKIFLSQVGEFTHTWMLSVLTNSLKRS